MIKLFLVTTVFLRMVCPPVVLGKPPQLITASPKFWAVGIIPSNQKTISLTFDQTMRAGFMDWFGRGVLSPNASSNNLSVDQATFAIRVSLQPGKVYVLALNEMGIPGVGFQNERGESFPRHFLVFQTAGNPSQEDAPPRVVGTSPGNNAQDVNPATTKTITVSFDRAMEGKKHGFHLFEEKMPVDLKNVSFTYSPDGKIFTLNYPLKPSTRYEVVMNSSEDIGFAATNRVPLWPVPFSFTTGQPR